MRLLLALLFVVAAVTATDAAAADDFGPFVDGKFVYDRLGVLSSADVTRLENRIGTDPIVVYLRSKSASASQTEDDARALMDAWHVESTPGAKDGAVVMVNFDSSDRTHGQVAIYAGASLHQTRSDLQQITGAMAPALREGRTEQALELAVSDVQRLSAGESIDDVVPNAAASASTVVSRLANVPGFLYVLFAGFGLLTCLVPFAIIAIVVMVLLRSGRRFGAGQAGWTSGSSSWSDSSTYSSSSSSFSDSGSSSSTSDGGSSGSSSF